MTKEMLSTKDVAEYLNIECNQVYRLLKNVKFQALEFRENGFSPRM